MKTNIEIEFKCLLNEKQYLALKNDYYSTIKPISQTNVYFIDDQQLLFHNRCSLRVRELNGTFEFTLKKPQGFSKLEFNEILSQENYQKLLNNEPFPSTILEELKTLGVLIKDLHCQTSLTTQRLEIPYCQGLLCLDLNTYNGHTDYEIEYEAQEENEGRLIFEKLLKPYGLNYNQNCQGKMARALACQPLD